MSLQWTLKYQFVKEAVISLPEQCISWCEALQRENECLETFSEIFIWRTGWWEMFQKLLRLPKYLFSGKPKLQFKSWQYIYQYFHSQLHFLTFMPKHNSVKGHNRTQVLLSVWSNKQNKWPSFTLAWWFRELTNNRSWPLFQTQRNIHLGWNHPYAESQQKL